jgi:hypothetical protein
MSQVPASHEQLGKLTGLAIFSAERISFWIYLKARLLGAKQIPHLSALIETRALAQPRSSPLLRAQASPCSVDMSSQPYIAVRLITIF